MIQAFVVGMALFSMFFGGGNLTFPIWIGSETASVSLSSLGFILSGVLLPLYGTIISLYLQGDYEYYLNTFGKKIGALLLFSLLVFWIPLGSGPRCNLLAYGAFVSQTAWDIPLWVYSAAYSVVVYLLTFRESRVIEILGKIITPMLIATLLVLICSLFTTTPEAIPVTEQPFSGAHELFFSFFAGYDTMDFIAAIFFSATVIALVKEKQKDKFDIRLIRNACLITVTLLSIIYIGLIAIGHAHADILTHVSKDRLLVTLGQTIFDERFQIIIFAIITLSVLSTSMALSLVFSNYIRKFIFKEKLSHELCLFISIVISFLMSIIGFDKLAIVISYATSALYPFLLLVTSTALAKDLYHSYSKAPKHA